MGLVNLKEMAKRLKRTEEEVMYYVESGIIKSPAYCYPSHFGDGKAIAFYPEEVLAQIEAKKAEPTVEVEAEEEVIEPATMSPVEEPEVEPEAEEPEAEETEPEPEPEPEKPKAKKKAKKTGKK